MSVIHFYFNGFTLLILFVYQLSKCSLIIQDGMSYVELTSRSEQPKVLIKLNSQKESSPSPSSHSAQDIKEIKENKEIKKIKVIISGCNFPKLKIRKKLLKICPVL